MKKNKSALLGVPFGILCLILATALSLGMLHVCDLLYRASVEILDIPEISGYSREVIMRNYHDTMRYLSPFNNSGFQLSDLKFSEGGAQHFADTKNIFNAIYIAGIASLIGIAAIIRAKKGRDKSFLRTSSITTLALPLFVAAAVVIDFNSMFILFHKIFFNNDLWIFDWRTDEIIRILPSEFFMYCAIFIVVFWILASAVQYIIYRRDRRTGHKI